MGAGGCRIYCVDGAGGAVDSRSEEIEMEIGTKLRACRKDFGFTLKQLSRTTGLSISFLSELERNKVSPSLRTLAKICFVYGISLSKMLEGIIVREI